MERQKSNISTYKIRNQTGAEIIIWLKIRKSSSTRVQKGDQEQKSGLNEPRST